MRLGIHHKNIFIQKFYKDENKKNLMILNIEKNITDTLMNEKALLLNNNSIYSYSLENKNFTKILENKNHEKEPFILAVTGTHDGLQQYQ